VPTARDHGANLLPLKGEVGWDGPWGIWRDRRIPIDRVGQNGMQGYVLG
jgi:hypothetical protein